MTPSLYDQFIKISPSDTAPEWLKEKKLNAFEYFKKEGFPTAKNEAWKYVSIESILKEAPRLKTLSHTLPSSQSGVVFSGLDTFPDAVSAGIPQTIFSYLNTLKISEGLTIHITECLQSPIVFSECIERVSVVVESGGNATLYITDAHQVESINTMMDITIKPGGILRVVRADYQNKNTRFSSLNAHLYKDAHFTLTTLVQGGVLNRYDTQINIHDEGVTAHLNGIGLLSNTTECYNHLLINHFSGGSVCKQRFKSILTEKAKTEFSGVVHVHKQAHNTDSQQHNDTLLLSDHARSLSRPQLIIDADDVECAHGATIGQLHPNEVFYIKSRGLNEKEAAALLTFGFAEEIIDTIEDSRIHAELTAIVREEISGYA